MATNISLLNSNNQNNINTNFERVATALQNTIGRDGTTPNQMNADLDLNNNDLLNVGLLDANDVTIDGQPVNGILTAAIAAAAAAAVSEDNAAGSEANAAVSASSASLSEEAAASSAALAASIAGYNFDTVANLLADTNIGYTGTNIVATGDIVEAQGFRYSVAASGASDHHVTTAGGVKLYVLSGVDGYNVLAFGAKGDYNNTTGIGTDDTIPIQAAFNAAMDTGINVHFPGLQYRVTDTISLLNANYAYLSFGAYGENGNSTRIWFDNLTALKNLFYIDSDINYFHFSDIEVLDKNARTSRAFYFYDTRATGSPSWKHFLEKFRITQFAEGVRFDGAATVADDAHESEVMFLHGKFRNNKVGLIYNNVQAVNQQLIGVDFENDQGNDATEKWPHIKFERGTTVNHIGGSVIGYGPYVQYTYTSAAGFAATSQIVSRGIRMEGRGDGPFIDHGLTSTITLSNAFTLIFDAMTMSITGHTAPVLARFGGRSFARFTNCQSNVNIDVQGIVTTNMNSNGEVGRIEIDNCRLINYKRIYDQAGYGSAAVAASVRTSVPAEISRRNEGVQVTVTGGYTTLLTDRATIYQGGWQVAAMKCLTWAPTTDSGLGSGSNPATLQVTLPIFARPCKFRLLRDDINAGSPYVLDLRFVLNSPTAISGAANNGSGLIRITTTTAHGLTTGDGVTISGVVGTTEANAQWAVTVITTTTFDLVASTFTNAYVSGGTFTIDRTVASITPTANVGGHFETNITHSSILVNWVVDGVVWDGKMKIVKSGTVNGFVGLIMIDYM